MPTLNANIRTLNLYVELPKVQNSYFVAHLWACISFLPGQWLLHKTNSTFSFHFWMCTHLPTRFSFRWLMSKKGQKGKVTTRGPVFPFPLCRHFSISSWLIQEITQVRENLIGFLECSCFLERHPLLSSCILRKFWFEWKAWSLWVVSAPVCSP